MEKNAYCDTHIYDPKGTKYIYRAFFYQIRGLPDLENLEEEENFELNITFQSGDRKKLKDLKDTHIYKAIDF